MGFCWFTSSRGPSSQWLSGRTMDSSGSWHWLKRNLPSPKSFNLALQSRRGILLAHLHGLEDTGHQYGGKKKIKKNPLEWEMLTLEGKHGRKGGTTPCRVWVGNDRRHRLPAPPQSPVGPEPCIRHSPKPPSSFFMRITSKCLLGLLGAWCEFSGSFPRTINTRSILLYSVLFVLLIWY